MWEFEVQAQLRHLRPPLKPPRHMLVACDDEHVAAVAVWQELDGPGAVEVEFGAVALQYRGSGGGLAREMLTRTLDVVTSRALEAGVDEVLVGAWIWHENYPSKRLCAGVGFTHTGWGAVGVEQWSGRIPVAGADVEEPARLPTE